MKIHGFPRSSQGVVGNLGVEGDHHPKMCAGLDIACESGSRGHPDIADVRRRLVCSNSWAVDTARLISAGVGDATELDARGSVSREIGNTRF